MTTVLSGFTAIASGSKDTETALKPSTLTGVGGEVHPGSLHPQYNQHPCALRRSNAAVAELKPKP